MLTNLEKERLAVIVGDAGQGKSSFVRHLTIQLAKQSKQNGLSRELFFPLYLECKNIDRNTMSSYENFRNELAEKAGLSRPALDAVMRFGKPLYIFDAMDEIPPDHMDALVDAIYKHIYIQNNQSPYFLFTSRPGQRLISGEADFSIGNNNKSVVRKYSVKEFEESQQELNITNLAKAKKVDNDLKITFLQALRNKESAISDYHSISRNPFMLFAIFSTYTKGQDLPENRFDAIGRVIDDVIERDLKKKDYRPINKKNIKEILGAVSCLFYQQRDMGKTPHASTQTPYDLAEKIYHLDDSDRDDRKLLNKYSEFFESSNLLDENGFRHEFLASTYAAYYLLFLMKSKVKKEKSPLEVNDIYSLKNNTDYWKGVTEALLCLIDRESKDSKTYIEPLIDELQNVETPDYDTLCSSVSQFVNHQPRAATLLLSGMLKRGCDGIEYGEQTDSGFLCHIGVNPYEELFYYPAIFPYLQQYLSNLTAGNKQSEKLYLCSELIREVCALFSEEYYQKLQIIYKGRSSSEYPDIVKKLADAAGRRGRFIHGYVRIRNEETEIGEYTFYDCASLTDITIPAGVTRIGDKAFSGCTNLTSVIFPESVIEIGSSAFYGCTGLSSVTIPEGVTEIKWFAFSDCTGLTNITIPNSVTKIGSNTFSGCTGLTSINVCDNNPYYSSLDGVLFNKMKTAIISYPNGRTGVYSIPDSVKRIDVDAFSYSIGLTDITIPDSVITISDHFIDCTVLTGINVCDNNPYYSSLDGVLFNKMKTAIISYPNGRTGAYTIPDSVTKIEWFAFYHCADLTDITIPNSVTEIGETAFSSCTGLTGINVYNNNTYYSSLDGVLFNKDKTAIILCPQGKTGSYTIPDGITEIRDKAFSDCTNLTSVTIPNSVKKIGSLAFHRCTCLTGINVCDNNPNYSSIEGVLFNKDKTAIVLCPQGKTGAYTIPDSVTEIGEDAFLFCTGLTSITIPNSVTKIEWFAFSCCTGLTGISIPHSVTEIGRNAFFECTGLTDISVCDNNPNYSSIDGVLFNKDKTAIILCPQGKIGTYTIPGSVTEIVECAFSGCTGLTSITIPDSVTEIRMSAFLGCTGLIIHGQKGSYAESYSKSNGIPFVAE